MPEGIRLEIDGRYAAMFSYKMKNYVLQDDAGKMTIRGSALRSRGFERFQRRFMEEMFRLLLEDRRGEIPKLHDDYRARLARHEIGIADLMKTETLQDSLDTYRSKIGDNSRNLAAAYELALKAKRPYLAGDQISYYVTGRRATSSVSALAKMAADYDPRNPDENVEYYLFKLADLFDKFRIFVEKPGLFEPVAETAANPAQLSLFGAPAAKSEEPNAEPEVEA
jgi:DNA polymerase elongation subunit (family B)